MRRLIWVGAIATGCAHAPDDSGDTDDTDGGLDTGNAYSCAEDTRAPVTDPDVASPGMGFAPGAAAVRHEGVFAGELAPVDTGQAPVPLELAIDAGAIAFVTSVLVGGGDTGIGEGAPEFQDTGVAGGDCPPRYEITLAGQISTTDGALAESFAAVSLVYTETQGGFSAAVPLAEVQGTLAPVSIVPSEWDAVSLVVDARLDESGAWSGTVGWSASNEAAAGDPPRDTGADVDTGYVEPSGMYETAGSFVATRQ